MKLFTISFAACILLFIHTLLIGCETKPDTIMNTDLSISKSDSNDETELSCKLTTPELQHRKATVLANMKKAMLEKKELERGYAYKFTDSDSMMYELVSFIRTEMQCCDFFAFALNVNKDKGYIWLEVTGGTGAKEFIDSELEI